MFVLVFVFVSYLFCFVVVFVERQADIFLALRILYLLWSHPQRRFVLVFVFVLFCSCICRKINRYFSCTENFVFIVEPPAADVCIRGGRGLYGRAQQYAHWPVIGKKIQTQIQIQIQIRKQIHGWALQYAHRPTMDRQMKEIYSVGSNIEQKLPFWGEVHKRKQIRKQMLWGKHSSTLCKN